MIELVEISNKKIKILFFTIFITIIIFILFYKLGSINFQYDENVVASVIKNLIENSKLNGYNFVSNTSGEQYDRAWPQLFLMYLSVKIFGLNEVSIRLVSILEGLLLIIVIYKFCRNLLNLNFIITAVILISIFTYFRIHILFRQGYMYALFILLYSFIMYRTYLLIFNQTLLNSSIIKIIFDLAIIIIFTFILISTHLLGYYILIFFAILIVGVYINTLRRVLILALAILIFSLILAQIKDQLININLMQVFVRNLDFFSKINNEYLEFLFGHPFKKNIGFLLFITSPLIIYYRKNSFTNNQKFFLLTTYFNIVILLIYLIFFTKRYAAFKYISNIFPLLMIYFISVYHIFLYKLKPNYQFSILGIFSLVMALEISLNFNKIIDKPMDINYSKGYSIINKNASKDDIILGKNIRDYYLDNLHPETKLLELTAFDLNELGYFYKHIKNYSRGWFVTERQNQRKIGSELKGILSKDMIAINRKDWPSNKICIYEFRNPQNKISCEEINIPKEIFQDYIWVDLYKPFELSFEFTVNEDADFLPLLLSDHEYNENGINLLIDNTNQNIYRIFLDLCAYNIDRHILKKWASRTKTNRIEIMYNGGSLGSTIYFKFNNDPEKILRLNDLLAGNNCLYLNSNYNISNLTFNQD